VNEVMPSLERWGHLRHNGALLPANVADAIVAMVSAPKGTHLTPHRGPARSTRTPRTGATS
jgi:hypothetical protein